jgi:GDP-4-dehydro-6-deoxy-D-mannose reductase
MSNILVFGASGFIGSYVVEKELQKKNKVLGTHFNPTINYFDYKDIYSNLVKCNINNYKSVYNLIKKFNPDYIYLLAAQSYPVKSMKDPFYTLKTNIIGTTNIYHSIYKLGLKSCRVIVACSSAQYGNVKLKDIPVNESNSFKPLHPYGVSKVATELLGFHYYINYGLKIVFARIFNTTGPRKRGDMCADFTQKAVLFELGEIKKIDVGNLFNKRAICDVRDCVDALSILLRKGKIGQSYNISANKTVDPKKIIEEISKNLSKKILIKKNIKLFRKNDEKIIYGDSTKIFKEFSWKQKISLSKTIKDMLNYWRQFYSV